jgi:hypothetical protein
MFCFFFWCSHKKCLAACNSAGRGVIIEFNVRCLALSLPQSLSFMDSRRSRSLIPIDALFLRSKEIKVAASFTTAEPERRMRMLFKQRRMFPIILLISNNFEGLRRNQHNFASRRPPIRRGVALYEEFSSSHCIAGVFDAKSIY